MTALRSQTLPDPQPPRSAPGMSLFPPSRPEAQVGSEGFICTSGRQPGTETRQEPWSRWLISEERPGHSSVEWISIPHPAPACKLTTYLLYTSVKFPTVSTWLGALSVKSQMVNIWGSVGLTPSVLTARPSHQAQSRGRASELATLCPDISICKSKCAPAWAPRPGCTCAHTGTHLHLFSRDQCPPGLCPSRVTSHAMSWCISPGGWPVQPVTRLQGALPAVSS